MVEEALLSEAQQNLKMMVEKQKRVHGPSTDGQHEAIGAGRFGRATEISGQDAPCGEVPSSSKFRRGRRTPSVQEVVGPRFFAEQVKTSNQETCKEGGTRDVWLQRSYSRRDLLQMKLRTCKQEETDTLGENGKRPWSRGNKKSCQCFALTTLT